MLRCVFCGYCVDACPEEAIIMSNNYDMAYFSREQSIVGKADLMKPFTFDEEPPRLPARLSRKRTAKRARACAARRSTWSPPRKQKAGARC